MATKKKETRATLHARAEKAEADAARLEDINRAQQSQLAWQQSQFTEVQAERATERHIVERILHTIQRIQPLSYFLPDALKPSQSDIHPNWTRLTPPLDVLNTLWDQEPTSSFDVMHPINLHDLQIVIDRHYDSWSRLVSIRLKPSTQGLNDYRMAYKISDELLDILVQDRASFCSDIGHKIAAAIYEAIKRDRKETT